MFLPKADVVTIALHKAVRGIETDLQPAMARLKATALSSVNEAEALARQARHASGLFGAVKPTAKPTTRVDLRVEPDTVRAADDRVTVESIPEPESITQKYNALRNFK